MKSLIKALLAAATVFLCFASFPSMAVAANETPRDLVLRVSNARDPKAVYDKLTPDQQAIVRSEFSTATFKVTSNLPTRLGPASGSVVASAFSGCWSLSAEISSMGGVTGRVMYVVGQTTTVCVSGGGVTYVGVSNAYTIARAIFIWVRSTTTGTNNVGWEGRGVAIGTVSLGTGGWEIISNTTCTQLRLNANGYNYVLLRQCSL